MTYIPEGEFELIKRRLQRVIERSVAETGQMPAAASIRLRPDDEGESQGTVEFLLVLGDDKQVAYETSATMEVDGIPDRMLRMVVK